MSNDKYDAIVMVEVLEHFIDPVKALSAIKRFSTGRTVLFGTTPNTDSLHWKESKQDIYVPEDHIFLFNSRSLTYLADKTDMKELTIEYFGSGKNNDSNLMFCCVI